MIDRITDHTLRLLCAHKAHNYGLVFARFLLVAGLVIVPGAANAFTASLNASEDPNIGDFDVTWSNPSSKYYHLQEMPSGGTWSNKTWTNGTSHSFTDHDIGDFSYRLRHTETECSGWPEPICYDVYTYSETITVTVADGGISTTPSEGTVDDVARVPYGIDVASDGDAVISVPIQVIPGVAGFQPSIRLEYDSGRGVDQVEQSLPEDTLGYGWRLAGLSQIRRCVVGQSSSNSIDLTTNDSLCLNGMPLVRTGGTHLAVGATYRTQIESYIKIEIKGSTGLLWFEATLPDGAVQEYGNGGYSRVDQNGGTDFQWSISKATSADGNVIDYLYWHDISNGINYPVSITYADAEIDLEYESRTDTSAVSIGSASQTQPMLLHTILVKYDDDNVREYRLLDETVASRRRLNKIQLCGYNEAGSTASCLTPMDVDWMTPSSTMTGVDILVDGVTDSLGADFEIEYGTITGSSHTFLFTERPFGNGTAPTDTQLLSGSGVLRHVTTKLRRDNGLGGFHDTTYAYQNKGLESTKHWGFLGFYAQRITDGQSDIVTYVQYRMDYPYFGQVARLKQFDDVYPSNTITLTRTEIDYDKETITHSVGSTDHPYAKATTSFIYEGTQQLGATNTANVPTYVSGFVDKIVSTEETGTGVSEGSAGSTWGDVATFTISGLLNTRKTAVEFDNRTTSGKWLINFADDISTESWLGAQTGTSIVQDAALTPELNSMNVSDVTLFPNHTSLELTTSVTFDSSGRLTDTTVAGDNVASRTTSITSFKHDRYPGAIDNPLDQSTTYNSYDVRFGTPKSRGAIDGRNTTRLRDEFGRQTSFEDGDDVETTRTYVDCPTGCSVTSYSIAPRYYVEVDSPIIPKTRTYFDVLDRVIRTEVESFDGTEFSKRDVKFDTQGRVEKSSLPYFSGTTNDIVPTYDLRNRIDEITRPDGSSIELDYSVSGSSVIVEITDNVKNADGTSAGTQLKRDEYNILGQLTKTTDGYGTSIDPFTSYTYDANGNVLTVTVNGGTAGSTTTTYAYDEAGNRESIEDPNFNPSGTNSGEITMTYTALGELLTRTDNKGQKSTYDYDLLSRIEALDVEDPSSNAIHDRTWTWDSATNGVGKIGVVESDGGQYEATYFYSPTSRLKKVTHDLTPIGEIPGTGNTFTTNYTFDANGRIATKIHPGTGLVASYIYNAQGYLSQIKNGTTVLFEVNDMDAFGNIVDEDYANGVQTLRTFDPETGRLTDIETSKGATDFQENDYAWRSNGTLESRIANPITGITSTRKETFAYDVLNRVTEAKTYIDSSNTRDLDYGYNDLGNLTSKTSTLSGDTDVTSYAYGAGSAGPHAVTSASIDGTNVDLDYDDNGAVTEYDIAGTSDDKYIAYNAFNQPVKIVIGDSIDDTTPEVVEEFAYGPDGQRYARKTTWKEGSNTLTEDVRYIGDTEVIEDDSSSGIDTITKNRVTPNIMRVKIVGTSTDEFFEYAHRDHLGSIEIITDESGNVKDYLAFEPFGSRKESDWTSNISQTELDDLLALATDHPRRARGFTGHEHLDRTGFIHMNGRVYDPALGRFLSPDPIISQPRLSQRWNRYSYVMNSPLSLVDPSGFDDAIPSGQGGAVGASTAPLDSMSEDIANVYRWNHPDPTWEDRQMFYNMRHAMLLMEQGRLQPNSGPPGTELPHASAFGFDIRSTAGVLTGLAIGADTAGGINSLVPLGSELGLANRHQLGLWQETGVLQRTPMVGEPGTRRFQVITNNLGNKVAIVSRAGGVLAFGLTAEFARRDIEAGRPILQVSVKSSLDVAAGVALWYPPVGTGAATIYYIGTIRNPDIVYDAIEAGQGGSSWYEEVVLPQVNGE